MVKCGQLLPLSLELCLPPPIWSSLIHLGQSSRKCDLVHWILNPSYTFLPFMVSLSPWKQLQAFILSRPLRVNTIYVPSSQNMHSKLTRQVLIPFRSPPTSLTDMFFDRIIAFLPLPPYLGMRASGILDTLPGVYVPSPSNLYSNPWPFSNAVVRILLQNGRISKDL